MPRSFRQRPGATIEISMESLRFLGPDVAKEDGQTRVKPGGGEPASLRRLHGVLCQAGGRWLYSSVREEHARRPRAPRAAQGTGMDDRRMDRQSSESTHSRDLPLVGRQELPAPRIHDSSPGPGP